MDYKITEIQVALFFSSIDVSSKLKLASFITKSGEGQLDIDPTLLPFIPDAPPEIPLITIDNNRSGWKFQLSKARCDLVAPIKDKNTLEEEKNAFNEVREYILSIMQGLSKDFAARFYRIGLIPRFISKEELENANQLFSNKFLKTTYSSDIVESRLHVLKKFEAGPFKLNQWIRINSTANQKFILEIDLNNQFEEKIDLNAELTRVFFEIATPIIFKTVKDHQ